MPSVPAGPRKAIRCSLYFCVVTPFFPTRTPPLEGRFPSFFPACHMLSDSLLSGLLCRTTRAAVVLHGILSRLTLDKLSLLFWEVLPAEPCHVAHCVDGGGVISWFPSCYLVGSFNLPLVVWLIGWKTRPNEPSTNPPRLASQPNLVDAKSLRISLFALTAVHTRRPPNTARPVPNKRGGQRQTTKLAFC